jgi:hypothetical protein
MKYLKAIEIIKNRGFKAYEIHKATGLNESGIRRVLNNEVESPQRKTKEVLIKFALEITGEKEVNSEELQCLEFNKLKSDEKLNMLFKMLLNK